MLKQIILFSLRKRLWVILGLIAILFYGLLALAQIRIDAVPDITNKQIQVNTKTGALDPEQIEKTVTYFIENELSSIQDVEDVRSLSKYGLSQVTVIFKEHVDLYWARQQVAERLQVARESIPDDLSPEMAPMSTGLGEVFMYVVQPKPGTALANQAEQAQLLYLRSIQEFVVRPYLKANVAGIADVDSTGGYKKEIHIDVNPIKLDQYGLTLQELLHALESLGENFGGGYIQHEGKQIIVRADGHIQSLDTLKNIPVKLTYAGGNIRLSQVAEVREDYVQRLGGATFNGKQAVLGTVLMRVGANSRSVAHDSEEAITHIPLPDNVQLKTVYSRRFLVDATIHTVLINLAEGAGLVILVLVLLLGNLRAALLVALALPLSMLAAAIGMAKFGISANLMSLGAIDFGLLVDGSVVIIENVMRNLSLGNQTLSVGDRIKLVADAAYEVAKPVCLGLVIIMIVYMPILALEGVEGKLFRPMAQTVLMALGASLLVALVAMPVLALLVLRGHAGKDGETRLYKIIHKGYMHILNYSLRHTKIVLGFIILLMLVSGYLYTKLGSDFMPPLDEGDLLVNLVRDNNISVDESIKVQMLSEQQIMSLSEVEHVFSRFGTSESATDPMGIHLSDTFVILHKDAKGRPVGNQGSTTKTAVYDNLEKLIAQNVPQEKEIIANQPIEMRFAEILEGSRADVALRIYGSDLNILTVLVDQAIEIIEPIQGAEEVEMDGLTALRKSPVLNARLDSAQLLQYGLELSEANKFLEVAMSGATIGSYSEHNRRYPIKILIGEEFKNNPELIRTLPVGLPHGGSVPISRLATFELKDQVTTIAHHKGQRYAGVSIYIQGRDTRSFVAEAQQKINSQLRLPPGHHLEWGGQFKNMEKARQRLLLIIPLILLILLVLIWNYFGNLRNALIVLTGIPLAVTGGVIALYFRNMPMTVSASIGFIALTGIALLNGLVLVTVFNQLRTRDITAENIVKEGASARLRPVLMTALVASLGFIPMAFNTGIGAEIQRPLATVVIGGLVSSTILTLLIVPMVYLFFEEKHSRIS